MEEPDPYLTVEQVASMFQVSPFTVRHWLREGTMQGIKLSGTRWRIKQSEVNRYANQKYGESA